MGFRHDNDRYWGLHDCHLHGIHLLSGVTGVSRLPSGGRGDEAPATQQGSPHTGLYGSRQVCVQKLRLLV